jgi:cephalosporin-C deacetylase
MALFDLGLAELERYAPTLPRPEDFGAFWSETLAEAAAHELDVRMTPIDHGLKLIESWDVVFAGFGGHPIRAWLHLPASRSRDEALTTVIQYQGYGGGRGLAHESTLWANAGYAHLVVDTRGQGSAWSVGESDDPVGSSPSQPGFMTRGILDEHDYYYRRVYIDAIRATDVVRQDERLDNARIAVAGASQGGGIALSVSAFLADVAAVMVDVPFLCDFPRAIAVTDRDPYSEITRYLRVHRDKQERVLLTLSYFDCVLLVTASIAPALFSVALMDETCPPSTVYAAYHAYAGPKELVVYPYNDHEGGGASQQARQISWLRELWGSAP